MSELIEALRQVLNNVGPDGRVAPDAAERLRRAATARHPGLSGSQLLERLPAFDTLPAATRRALYDTVARDDAWSMWLRKSRWRQSATRALRGAMRKRPGQYRQVRRALEISELLFLYWQARIAHMVYRGVLGWRGRTARGPSLAAALKIAGIDARDIASSYLHEIPQPQETAAYWHDAGRHRTVGVVLGIDFIVNDEGVWFVESNLNAGLTEERSVLYSTDPFVENLVQFAKQNGYTSMVYLACNDFCVDDIMAGAIERVGRAAGLEVTVLEDRYSPQRTLSQTFLVPAISSDRTLVVRSKLFHTALDAQFHHKTVSLAVLEAYQRAFPDRDVRLPPSGADVIRSGAALDSAFPNVVCKFPERDQGQGVIFMKVPSLQRAQAILDDTVEMNKKSVANIWTKLRYRLKLEDQTSIFQAYIPSSLVDGRRLAVARAHVLATPVGIQFLSAHRIVSNRAVPESLGEGLVQDARPYIVNYSLDAEHALMPPDEEIRVAKAAVSVARALSWAVESRFETGPVDQPAEEPRRRSM